MPLIDCLCESFLIDRQIKRDAHARIRQFFFVRVELDITEFGRRHRNEFGSKL